MRVAIVPFLIAFAASAAGMNYKISVLAVYTELSQVSLLVLPSMATGLISPNQSQSSGRRYREFSTAMAYWGHQ